MIMRAPPAKSKVTLYQLTDIEQRVGGEILCCHCPLAEHLTLTL